MAPKWLSKKSSKSKPKQDGHEPTPKQPPVASDKLPTHFFDDAYRQVVLCWTMRFEDVLDVETLRSSFCQLLEIGSWRKLGGRLRLNTDGKVEIHVPLAFAEDRPAVRFSHVDEAMPILDHPLASKLPRRTEDACALQHGPDAFRPLGSRDGAPSTLADYVKSDEPMLQIHVVTFNDATLVSLNWPHVLSDAMGMQAVVRAWGLVMAGKESEVPPLLGVHEDPLADLGTSEGDQKPTVARYHLTGFGKTRFLARFIATSIFWPVNDSRTIFLSARAVAKMRADALAQLPVVDQKGKAIFISDNDLITAWLSRTTSRFLSPKSRRNVLITVPVDLRTRVKSLAPPWTPGSQASQGVYVQNVLSTAYVNLPASKVVGRPLGELAFDVRAQVLEQTQEDQVEAFFRWTRKSIKATGKSPALGTPNCFWVFSTSWMRCKVWEVVDFSPAVVEQAGGGNTETGQQQQRGNQAGKPDYYHSFGRRSSPMAPNGFHLLGRDSHGNHWITGTLTKSLWKHFEAEAATLA